MWPQCWGEGKDPLSWPVHNTSSHWSLGQHYPSLCKKCKDAELVHVHHDPLFLPRCFPDCIAFSLFWCLGLLIPRCRTMHLSLLKSISYLSTHFSSLLSSLRMPVQSSGISLLLRFVSLANFLGIDSEPSFRSPVKMLARIEPYIDIWGTLLFTDLQIHLVPRISLFMTWLFICFSMHLIAFSSSLYICRGFGNQAETPIK